jgi:tRNA-dihydrouridine synthase A
MVTANAIVHQQQKILSQDFSSDPIQQAHTLHRFLGQGAVEPLEGPSVLQLGGSDPAILAMATATVLNASNFRREYHNSGFCDYTAINLNCGCPSPKVAGSGCFGAALMEQPNLVKDCVIAMSQGCNSIFPITVKCRIGTDENIPFQKGSTHMLENKQQTYDKLCNFIDIVSSSGVVTDFQIHARIAVLDKNFSPLDNRNIPPLQYDLVYQLVRDFPHLSFSLNGGVQSVHDVQHHFNTCPNLKGVMVRFVHYFYTSPCTHQSV